MAKNFKIYDDAELTEARPVVAQYTDKNSKTKFTWKKSTCMFYPETNQKNRYANQGLTLAYQRVIRQEGMQAEGLATITAGGKARDLSEIKEV